MKTDSFSKVNRKQLSVWSKLSSETLMKNAYFEIVKDKIKIGDIGPKDYIYMNLTDAAMMIAMIGERKIVFIRQYRYLTQSEVIEFPAGGCEEGEDPELCARRECEEEAGYKCGKITKLGKFYESYGLLTRQIHVYFSNDVQKTEAKPDNNVHHYEEIETMLVDYNEACEMTMQNKIAGSQTVMALLLLKNMIDSGNIEI